MLVELTYSCSMGCSHCLSDCKPCNDHMSVEVLKDVIYFLNKNNVVFWNFSGGEMYENPNILEIL